jgi:hypothetical protein
VNISNFHKIDFPSAKPYIQVSIILYSSVQIEDYKMPNKIKCLILVVTLSFAGCGYTIVNLPVQKQNTLKRNKLIYEYLGIDYRIFGTWEYLYKPVSIPIVDAPSYSYYSSLRLKISEENSYWLEKNYTGSNTPDNLYMCDSCVIKEDTLIFRFNYKHKPYKECYLFRIENETLLLNRFYCDSIPGISLPPVLPDKMNFIQ